MHTTASAMGGIGSSDSKETKSDKHKLKAKVAKDVLAMDMSGKRHKQRLRQTRMALEQGCI